MAFWRPKIPNDHGSNLFESNPPTGWRKPPLSRRYLTHEVGRSIGVINPMKWTYIYQFLLLLPSFDLRHTIYDLYAHPEATFFTCFLFYVFDEPKTQAIVAGEMSIVVFKKQQNTMLSWFISFAMDLCCRRSSEVTWTYSRKDSRIQTFELVM